MTFARRRNRLRTRFSKPNSDVKRRISAVARSAEHVRYVTYLGCDVSYCYDKDLLTELRRLQVMSEIAKHTKVKLYTDMNEQAFICGDDIAQCV